MDIKLNGKTYKSTRKTKDIVVTTVGAILVGATMLFGFNVVNNIEMYSSTARYQLHNDVLSGDAEAIEFYQDHYLDRGIKLW